MWPRLLWVWGQHSLPCAHLISVLFCCICQITEVIIKPTYEFMILATDGKLWPFHWVVGSCMIVLCATRPIPYWPHSHYKQHKLPRSRCKQYKYSHSNCKQYEYQLLALMPWPVHDQWVIIITDDMHGSTMLSYYVCLVHPDVSLWRIWLTFSLMFIRRSVGRFPVPRCCESREVSIVSVRTTGLYFCPSLSHTPGGIRRVQLVQWVPLNEFSRIVYYSSNIRQIAWCWVYQVYVISHFTLKALLFFDKEHDLSYKLNAVPCADWTHKQRELLCHTVQTAADAIDHRHVVIGMTAPPRLLPWQRRWLHYHSLIHWQHCVSVSCE